MEKNKKYIILISVLVILLVIAVIIYFVSDDNSSEELLIDGDIGNIVDDSNVINDSRDDSDANTQNDNDVEAEDTSDEGFEKDNYEHTEEDVIDYFSVMEDEVENSSSFKDKFKEYFVTVVDFIFYDKDIKGYTFSELSGTAKAKVISVALMIDNKIEEYIPNYKENISSTTNKVYADVKEKLVTLYMDVSTDICKNNEDECLQVKEIFGEIKDVCKIGWDFIKSLISSGASKIKEWYEIYSGK